MEIQRKSKDVGDKKKLTGVGKMLIGGGILALLIVIVCIIVSVNGAQTKGELADKVMSAIEYSIQTCKNAVVNNKTALSEVEGYEKRINAEKKIDKKASLTQELIQYTLGQVGENDISNKDELNGAKSRVTLALRNYNEK